MIRKGTCYSGNQGKRFFWNIVGVKLNTYGKFPFKNLMWLEAYSKKEGMNKTVPGPHIFFPRKTDWGIIFVK